MPLQHLTPQAAKAHRSILSSHLKLKVIICSLRVNISCRRFKSGILFCCCPVTIEKYLDKTPNSAKLKQNDCKFRKEAYDVD